MSYSFIKACADGDLKFAKSIYTDSSIYTEDRNTLAFQSACKNGHLRVAKYGTID